jgi:uncharacterized protein (TIGR04222 family)
MTLNPFNLTAEPFLALYMTLAGLLFWWGFYLKSMIGPATPTVHPLSLLELAYLSGGANRVGDAALLNLISENGATITPKGDRISVTDQAPLAKLIDRPPSLAVLPAMTRQAFQKAMAPLVERVQGRLQQLGYYPSDEQMASFRRTVIPFVVLLFAFGTIKVFVGAGRNHPVGFLIVLLVITIFTGLALAKRAARTQAGKEALAAYQASHAREARAPLDHELLLAVALSGTVVLSGTSYASVYAASRTMNDGGGDGGGGCGGGGGGGGGCGGCS